MSKAITEKEELSGVIRIDYMQNLLPLIDSLLKNGYVVQATPVFDKFPRENNIKYYDVNYLKVV